MQATGPLVEQPLEYFQQVMDTNVTGAVRMTQAVVPAMLARVRKGNEYLVALAAKWRSDNPATLHTFPPCRKIVT